MSGTLSPNEVTQLLQTIEMFEVITQSQPQDYQSLEILKEAYLKLNREDDVLNTSRRIAQAYVQLGQLSSAILEYESILQRRPEDPAVMAALAEIEHKASSLTPAPSTTPEPETVPSKSSRGSAPPEPARRTKPVDVDDGRHPMFKLFVESKLISAGDFDLCWTTPDYASIGQAIEPFVQLLADRGTVPLERSLKVLAEKSRLGFLPLEKYDIDFELARAFPADACRRWCVLPFDRMSKSVLVATANPFNRQAAKELETATTCRLLWYLAPPPDILKGLKKAFR